MTRGAKHTVPLELQSRESHRIVHVWWDFGNRFVDPADLVGVDVPSPGAGIELALLSGRGPLWLYAALARCLHDRGLAVAVHDPREEGYVLSAPHALDIPAGSLLDEEGQVTHRAPAAACPAVQATIRGPGTAFSLAGRGGEQLPPGLLEGFIRQVREAPLGGSDAELVYWHGPAPTWLVVAFAVAFGERHGGAAVGVTAAQAGGIVVAVAGDSRRFLPGLVLPDPEGKGKPTTLYGIVGDPNSGKSVFSWRLYRALQRLGCAVYRLDCDIAAPTAAWSMGSPLGRQLRQAQKQAWADHFDVPMLIESLRGLRQSALDLALIDLPGGIHNDRQVARIPAKRRPLFAAIDRYLLVQRSDEVAEAWEKALTAANGQASIDQEVLSRPAGEAAHSARSQARRVAPLERDRVDEPDPAVEAIAAELATEHACR